jgi:subtilase family serine protease
MKNKLLFFLFILCSLLSQAQTRQILKSHDPSIVKKIKPIGALDPNTLVDLIIELPFRNEEAMAKKLHDLYDPANPDFRHFLTPGEFTETYGPTQNDFDELLNFAKANDLKIINAPPNRALLHIQAPAKAIERVFHVKMLSYKNPDNGKEFYATEGDGYLDIRLEKLEIFGLNNYENTIPQSFALHQSGQKTLGGGSGPSGGLMGNDFRNAYAPDASLTGLGQVVGLVAISDFSNLDINLYELMAGRSDVLVRRVFIDGLTPFATPPPIINGNLNSNSEISLDIEMALSMAPGAMITVYGMPPGTLSGDILNEIANPTMGEPLPNQISTSVGLNYGGDDSPRVYHAYSQMGMDGQSFFAASGDHKAFSDNANLPGPQPLPPADFPYLTSVGGTNLTLSGNGVSYISESTWPGSGGGPSPWFKIPAYQMGISSSSNLASTSMRNCPDVSMAASNIIAISNGGVQSNVVGTSASSPLWAGFMALVNEQAALNNLPSVGFLNPAIYTIGGGPGYPICFHDIQDGSSNTSSGNPNKYMAVTGYDLATGWGSPSGLNLINALALRRPDPLQIALQYVHLPDNGCDEGPEAGNPAEYQVQVSTGTAPFTYGWNPGGLTVTAGGTSTSPFIQVRVPPVGQIVVLSVGVTDALGSHFSASINVSGIDPQLAGEERSLCSILHSMMEFVRPIYINPGDPARLTREPDFSPETLRTISEMLTRMQGLIKSLQQVRSAVQ